MPRCSCLGKNPDCFRCGGWGWVGDSVSRNRSTYEYKKTSLLKERKISDLPNIKKKKKKGPKISCLYCSKWVRNLDHLSG